MPGLTQNKPAVGVAAVGKFRSLLNFAFQPRALYPATYALITFLLSQLGAAQMNTSVLGPSVYTWLASSPKSLAFAALIGVPMFVLNETLKRTKSVAGKYVVYQGGIIAISIMYALLQGVINARGSGPVTFGIVRLYLVISALSILAALFQRRLFRQVTRAENALLETERQRSLLLTADEATRREVAAFLHNRVQAGLVVTAMQLKMTAAKIGGPEEAELNSLIEELEQIRKFDVRSAGQQLSPDFELLDLEEALQDLIRGYKKTMEVHTVIDSDVTGLSAEMTLGIYRICEQAMLNAAVHGAATQCTIHIARDGAGARKIALTVENNGSWDASQGQVSGASLASSGAGAAVIEAWVKKFKGEWSLTGGANSVVTLKAVLFCELAC